jgi:hypothetical protein
METAKRDMVSVSLLASPTGFKLYPTLGFADLGAITVQVEGEEENIVLRPMSYVPETRSKLRKLLCLVVHGRATPFHLPF